MVLRTHLRSRILRKHDLEIEEICWTNDKFFIKDDTKITSRINDDMIMNGEKSSFSRRMLDIGRLERI